MTTWYLQSTGHEPLRITAQLANGFFDHLIGLLNSKSPPPAGHGLLLTTRGALHTFGMRFSIDIVYFDQHLQVLDCRRQIPPWRLITTPRKTRFCLEMMANASQHIQPGLQFTREAS